MAAYSFIHRAYTRTLLLYKFISHIQSHRLKRVRLYLHFLFGEKNRLKQKITEHNAIASIAHARIYYNKSLQIIIH